MIEPYLANAAASYHQRQAERDLRAARSTLATSGGSTRVSDLTTQVRACTSNLAGCLSPAQLLQTNAIDPAWEATIATDRAQQHTLPQQRPFSDSYAQGKPPAKRQKVIHEDSTPSQVFSSLFRQAVDNSNALPDGTSFSGTCLLACTTVLIDPACSIIGEPKMAKAQLLPRDWSRRPRRLHWPSSTSAR